MPIFKTITETGFQEKSIRSITNPDWLQINDGMEGSLTFNRILIADRQLIGTGVFAGKHSKPVNLMGLQIKASYQEIGIGIVMVVDLNSDQTPKNIVVHYPQSALLAQLRMQPNANVMIRKPIEKKPKQLENKENDQLESLVRQFYTSFAKNDTILKKKITAADLVALTHATGNPAKGVASHQAFAAQFYSSFEVKEVNLQQINTFQNIAFVQGHMKLLVKKPMPPALEEGSLLTLSLNDIIAAEDHLIVLTEFMHNPVMGGK
ncbi:MAG: hypothetical protein AAF849_19150 [Bacteroidota bacterium]